MHAIAELASRKTLIVAAVLLVAGLGLIGWTLVGVPPAEPSLGVGEEAGFDQLVAAGDELPPEEVTQATEEPQLAPDVVVYVSGAVAAPDVYRLPAEARIKDLVLAAGGLAADADLERINLAERVSDGQHITVWRVGESAVFPPGTGEAANGAAESGLVDINSADAEQLDALPGIGPAIAERIISHREANGPFASVEDLGQVKGIGAALLEQITPLVTVGL